MWEFNNCELDKVDYAKNAKAFTYTNQEIRLIFIKYGFSQQDTFILLAHELYRIFENTNYLFYGVKTGRLK